MGMIDLQQAAENKKTILRHLLELCQHNYSEFNQADINEHGLFDYPYLDHYWTEPGRFPFLIYHQAQLAGFALVRQIAPPHQPPCHTVAEFFVLRKYRHQGIGQTAAVTLFNLFPGRWSVRQEAENRPAQQFWRRVIAEYTQGNYQEEAVNTAEWHGLQQTFHSQA